MQSTLDSQNKTTDPEPTGSKSSGGRLPTFQEREETLDCPKHGPQTAKVFRIYGPDFSAARCPSCDAEQAEEHKRVDQERGERDRARRTAAQIEGYLQRAGLPSRFQGKDFSNYIPQTDEARAILRTCQDFASHFPRYASQGVGLILSGNAGTGKSHLAAAIAQHVITEHRQLAVYMTAARAFRMVKDTYQKSSARTEQQVYDLLAEPALLILDEIGVQHGSDTERNIIFEIVNERYEAMKPTILISNLALPSLTEYAGERVIDRMKENGGKLAVFDWKSHRGAA
jgi:DNA replication protein DnaC